MENLSVQREVCDKMKGYNKIMEVLEKYLSCIILVFITFEIFIQIVFREIGLPLGWTEETARYLMIAAVFFTMSRAMYERRHLSVGILPIFLKKEWQKTLLDIVSNLFCLLFFGVLAVYGTIYLQKLALHPQKSPTVMINMMIPYAGVLIGIFLMVIRILQMLVEDIRKLCQSQRGGDGHE